MRVGAAVRVPLSSHWVGASKGNSHHKSVRGGAHHYCFFIALSWLYFPKNVVTVKV